MATFAVTLVHGPNWDTSHPIRQQEAWDQHAAFMDGLVAAGFIILGGPLGDGDRTLHLVQAASDDQINARLAEDPWAAMGLLQIGSIQPWALWLDGRLPNPAGQSAVDELPGAVTSQPSGRVSGDARGEMRREMSAWEKQIGAINLIVGDLERSKTFYREVFGLTPEHEEEGVAVFRFQDTYVFLQPDPAPRDPAGEVLALAQKGVGQFAIIVKDVDAVRAELAGHGVTLISGPADRDWGMRTLTFADPGGYIWEIAQELP